MGVFSIGGISPDDVSLRCAAHGAVVEQNAAEFNQLRVQRKTSFSGDFVGTQLKKNRLKCIFPDVRCNSQFTRRKFRTSRGSFQWPPISPNKGLGVRSRISADARLCRKTPQLVGIPYDSTA